MGKDAMGKGQEEDDVWHKMFKSDLSSPQSPGHDLPPSLAHTLERVFRSYSQVSEESSVRVMPAAAFVRMASECHFIDERFTDAHLYQIISKHAGQVVAPKATGASHQATRSQQSSHGRISKAGLTWADFVRALQEIGEARQGAGKNGLHRLVYLNIIRFASLEGSPKTEGGPKTASWAPNPHAHRAKAGDALLQLVLDNVQPGAPTSHTWELTDEDRSKWAGFPKGGREVNLVKKHLADLFSDVVEAFVFFDLHGSDVISMNDFRRGVRRLRLTDIDIEGIVRHLHARCKCTSHGGGDAFIDLISFIRVFAWHPVVDLAEWTDKYERAKLNGHVIVDRVREEVRARASRAPGHRRDVDLDLITSCSVLGTRWEEVRRFLLSGKTSEAKRRTWTPSPPRRRSLSPNLSAQERAWSQGLRSEKQGRKRSFSAGLGRIVNAISKADFFEALSKIPLNLTASQALKAFEFLDVDKNGWFHILQAEDVLRKTGYLPRAATTKATGRPADSKDLQDSIMQEMMKVECERTMALNSLADQWTASELELVNDRKRAQVQHMPTAEEQVRFDRSTVAAQKTLSKAMERQFCVVHQMFDGRLKRLRMQLDASPKVVTDGASSTNSRLRTESRNKSVAAFGEKTAASSEDELGHVPSSSRLHARRSTSPGCSHAQDKSLLLVQGMPSHSLQQALRRRLRNSSSLKSQGWTEFLRTFDSDHDGFLTQHQFFEAVLQVTAYRGSSEGQDRNSPQAKERGRSGRPLQSVGEDYLSVVLRILDAEGTGKVRIDEFVKFIFNSQQTPPSKQLPSPNMTHAQNSDRDSFDGRMSDIGGGMSEIPVPRSARTVNLSSVNELGPNALFEGSSFLGTGANIADPKSVKSLDPWAREKQLQNVVVPPEESKQSSQAGSRNPSKLRGSMNDSSLRQSQQRSPNKSVALVTPGVTFTHDQARIHIPDPNNLYPSVGASAPGEVTLYMRGGEAALNMSSELKTSPQKTCRSPTNSPGPPRQNPTCSSRASPKQRAMRFANEAPGVLARQEKLKSPHRSPRPRTRSPRRSPENSAWHDSSPDGRGALMPGVMDTTQTIRRWLLQQIRLGDGDDSGVEALLQQEQQSSPKVLSARDGVQDNTHTDGWIISPVTPSKSPSRAKKSRLKSATPRRSLGMRSASSEGSSEDDEGAALRSSSRGSRQTPGRTSPRGRGYEKMQDKIREKLRREWGASESESDEVSYRMSLMCAIIFILLHSLTVTSSACRARIGEERWTWRFSRSLRRNTRNCRQSNR